MTRHILFTATLLALSAGLMSAQAQKARQGSTTAVKSDVKFLNDISVDVAPAPASSDPKAIYARSLFTEDKNKPATPALIASTTIENAGTLQFKYALLMDLEVEEIRNMTLFQTIDEWFGTRYKLGGSTKDGIDCSALMQVFFTSLYGISLPRTAREQYSLARKISTTELKEGDLVFFNTIGGVSHVGMYLQNNKFVHASSGGVTISDLNEDYWLHHFIGVGRIDSSATAAVSTLKP